MVICLFSQVPTVLLDGRWYGGLRVIRVDLPCFDYESVDNDTLFSGVVDHRMLLPYEQKGIRSKTPPPRREDDQKETEEYSDDSWVRDSCTRITRRRTQYSDYTLTGLVQYTGSGLGLIFTCGAQYYLVLGSNTGNWRRFKSTRTTVVSSTKTPEKEHSGGTLLGTNYFWSSVVSNESKVLRPFIKIGPSIPSLLWNK